VLFIVHFVRFMSKINDDVDNEHDYSHKAAQKKEKRTAQKQQYTA